MKLLVEEVGSDTASALWDGCDAALSSRLAYPEVCAALAAARRNRDLDNDAYLVAARDWDEFWNSVRPVELTASVERHAAELANRRSLRGADAVHLASALAIASDDLVVAVWDRRLHEGALAEQLLVAPAVLPMADPPSEARARRELLQAREITTATHQRPHEMPSHRPDG